MKKIVFFAAFLSALFLAGCVEITDELTIKEDGSGTTVTTNDMSTLVALMKGMGGADALGDAGDKAMDTTISLMNLADSISTLTTEEKDLIRKGELGLVINLKDEKMLTRLSIPFSKVDQVSKIKAISSKITNYFVGKNMGEGLPPGVGDKLPAADPFSEYYNFTVSKGLIEKKLNKEKYATRDEDASIKGLVEMADNGLPHSNTIIINLPKPAKSATGKFVTLSEDKKKVTIKGGTEDFMASGEALEFRIEY